MEVTCSQCKTKLNVPDDKLPKDQAVKINCPKCKNKITIEPPKHEETEKAAGDSFSETGKLHLKFIESKKKEKGGKDSPDYDDYSGGDERLEFYDEGTKLALVMVDESVQGKIQSAVEELGYKYIPVPNTRDALSKLRFHSFDVVFLADGFDGQQFENSPVMNYLNHLSMSSRRKIFLALFGDRVKTMDEMMAYSLSANVIINTQDLDKLAAILKRGISEYERFYKVFSDTLVEVGKA